MEERPAHFHSLLFWGGCKPVLTYGRNHNILLSIVEVASQRFTLRGGASCNAILSGGESRHTGVVQGIMNRWMDELANDLVVGQNGIPS